MPSPFIHVSFSLGLGSLLMAATKGNFTPIHCLVLTTNGFFGPDMGAFLNWYFELISPDLAGRAMIWIHNSIGYILLIAPLMSFLLSHTTKRFATWMNAIEVGTNTNVVLNVRDCYLLAIAGCLFHFQIDHVFEEDGHDSFYRWVLSTGHFRKNMPPLSPLAICYVSLCTLALVGGFIWIHLFSGTGGRLARMRETFGLFVYIFIAYGMFLFIAQYILNVKAVVGEEADLGVLLFVTVFHFAPFILCLLTVHA